MRIIGAAGLVLLSFHVAAAAADEPPKEKIICKRVTQADTGSHFSSSKRVCMTESDWKEQEDQTQRLLRDSRNRSNTSAAIRGGVGGGPQ